MIDALAAVRVPTSEEEAIRDLLRAREDLRGDLMRARHRLSKLLLGHDVRYEDTMSTWNDRHRASDACAGSTRSRPSGWPPRSETSPGSNDRRSSCRSSVSCRLSTPPVRNADRARSRPAAAMRAGCSSRPPGTTARHPRHGTTLARRQEGQPAAAVAVSWKTQQRLHQIWRNLDHQRGKRRTLVAVAVAQHLAGFCWAFVTTNHEEPVTS